MMNKYGAWNDVSYYSNAYAENKLSLQDNNILISSMDESSRINIRYNNCSYKLFIKDFEKQILIRITASHGLTIGQLEKYFRLQGLSFEPGSLMRALDQLVEFGFLSRIQVSQYNNNKEVTLYNITDRGIRLLRNGKEAALNPQNDGFFCTNPISYIKSKLVLNQIILGLLSNCKCGLRSFFFYRTMRKMPESKNEKSLTLPLYVQTENRNYIFLYIGNIGKDTRGMIDLIDRFVEFKRAIPKKTIVVAIADTSDQMNRIAQLINNHKHKNIKEDLLFSVSDEWFDNSSGSFYGFVNIMGQERLINIDLL
jgi:hypothetical protein